MKVFSVLMSGNKKAVVRADNLNVGDYVSGTYTTQDGDFVNISGYVEYICDSYEDK